MPDSIQDFSRQITTLERKLRSLKRNILGTAAAGEAAINDVNESSFFEAALDTALVEWEQFQQLWDELEATHIQANLEFPSQSWQESYDSTRAEIIKAKAHRITIERAANQAATTSSIANMGHQSLNMSLSTSARAHLPQIPLPVFSGDLTKWSHFKDTFTSMVHNEPTLTNVEKFHYLLGSLRGEAASVVSRFPIEDKNYSQAWRKLLENYDNPRVLASLLLQKIIDCDFKESRNELQRYDKFLAEVADSIEGFKGLAIDEPAEFILASLALRSLDPSTRRNFEISRASSRTFPTADEVIQFVRQRKLAITMSRDLTSIPSASTTETPHRSRPTRFPAKSSGKYETVALHMANSGIKSPRQQGASSLQNKLTASSSGMKGDQSAKVPKQPFCLFCQSPHLLPHCFKFSSMLPSERIGFIRSIKCCRNCLRSGHSVSECKSKWSCRFCKGKHHSLIHYDEEIPSQNTLVVEDSSHHNVKETFTGFGSTLTQTTASTSAVLLGTAQFYVVGIQGQLITVRAVLDSGSQHTFITQALASEIGAKISGFNGHVTGLGGSQVSSPAGSMSCSIRPLYSTGELSTDALVVGKITPSLPNFSVPKDIVNKLSRYCLADRLFHTPGEIEMLIGMDLYPQVITGAPYKAGIDKLYLQPTTFGLVVLGGVNSSPLSPDIALFTNTQCSIDDQLKAFWELEEPKPVDMSDPEHKLCEEHFVRTYMRAPDGRYIVRLPLRPGIESLGRNREVAVKRFINLESKLGSDSKFKTAYKDFIKEYEELGHLSLAPTESSYIIPHHGIWQRRLSGDKLRVVFDASCPSRSLKSLNTFLLTGPKLQADICEVLIKFRLFRIPLCADLVKMYRQILIHPDDRHLQHIVWRDDQSEALRELQLNTVTYGVKSSAYQALRVIQQLVLDEGDDFPLAKKVVSTSMYVDDIVAGAENVGEAKELQRQLIGLFGRGGFTLSKWASTVSELVANDEKMLPITIKEHNSDCIKILGLIWNPVNDSFSYAVLPPPLKGVTKRIVLSSIARIFDPLGMLAPVIFKVKILLQEIWKHKLGWDELITSEMHEAWSALVVEWHTISGLSIKRHIADSQASNRLIGFCDASTKGYAAAIYCRSEESSGQVRVSLIKAKTKIAPLKYTSISRLELCGALLLSRLLASINIPCLKIIPPLCFTDSRVVLCWLRIPNHQLSVFEANRTSQILDTTPIESWLHVSSEDNPCDLASRGCSPSHLHNHRMWWHGPSWLTKPVAQWPIIETPTILPIQLPLPVCLSSLNETNDHLITRFSDFHRLVRVVALATRFLCVIRRPHRRTVGPISAEEFHAAKVRCVRIAQEALSLKDYTQLSPFIDEVGIIRVGGRLQNASINSSAKHPMLLPRRHHLSKLIVQSIHERHYHAGATLTLAMVRNEYWIPGALKLIRSIINRCIPCRIRRAKPLTPIMAPLPKVRLNEIRAFYEVGIDYAGPFLIKDSNRRKSPVTKAYLCLFICMSTKAIHLETVSALTTASFLSALDRFTSRRGLPQTLWSDHGTNFVGAARFLKDVYKFLQEHEDELVTWLAPKNVRWKFIPPRAPHFGGLWEAGIKSAKGLLAATIGAQPYTFEELSTIFIRIEGLLNSRPLCALNEDFENCGYLTPAHFLIGAPLSSLPEICDGPTKQTYPSRWERVHAHVRSIWDRWRQEYLHTLQQRAKWTKKTKDIKTGDLVILIEHRSIVGHWPVARVIETHPGKDGVIRTVTVRTPSNKTFVRAVVALAPLFDPEDHEPSSQVE